MDMMALTSLEKKPALAMRCPPSFLLKKPLDSHSNKPFQVIVQSQLIQPLKMTLYI
jgi:hypothetical protein